MREIYALGVGHSTPLFIEIAEAAGWHVSGLYHYNDERTGEMDHGFKILLYGCESGTVQRNIRNVVISGDDHIILPDYAMLVAGRYVKRSAAVYRKIIMRKNHATGPVRKGFL